MGTDLTAFFDQNIVYIYFFYGLSFFSMGLALLVESRRTSQLELAQNVQLLGWFGLLHGGHEFLEMFTIFGLAHTMLIDVVRVALLAISFLPLLKFGVRLLPYCKRSPGFCNRVTLLLAVAYIMQTALAYLTYQPTLDQWVHGIDTLARYSLGIPAAALAGFGLMRQRAALKEEDMEPFGRDFFWAGLALVSYGVLGQMFPGQTIIFPSMYINAELFQSAFGFPVQLWRGSMAVIVALAVIHALRIFEIETQNRLEVAVEAERELQAAIRELSLLYEASSLLTANYDLETLIEKAITRIVHIIEPIRSGVILLSGDDVHDKKYMASYGYSHEEMEPLLGTLDNYIQYGRDTIESQAAYSYWVDKDGVEVSERISSQPFPSRQMSPVPLRRVVLPLHTQQRLVGTLLLETDRDGPFLSSLEAPTIVALARQLAIAIENAELVLQLRQREARRAELLQRATAAQEAERKRIARELHDETGQALTALALGLRGISKLMEQKPDIAIEQIVQLQTISTHALEELRHLISDLRPSHLDDLGLVAALRWYTEQIDKRSHTKVDFNTSGESIRLTPEEETTLFRIAQEGLGNVIKHAQAEHAQLHLEFAPSCTRLMIRDDGRGFDTTDVLSPGAGRAWGLIGIQERAVLAGGELMIDSEPGRGTTIVVIIPGSRIESQEVAIESEAADVSH